MATTVNDVLNALDSYMQSNGGGQKYLANKFKSFFESKESIMNVKTGPLSKFTRTVDKMSDKAYSLNNSIVILTKKINDLNTVFNTRTFKSLNNSVNLLTRRIRAFRDAIPLGINVHQPQRNQSNNPLVVLKKIESNTLRTVNYLSSMQRVMLDAQKESIFGKRSVFNNTPNNSVINKSIQLFSNNASSRTNSQDKSSLLGTIIKTLALGSAAFLGLGVIGNFIKNSAFGKVVIDGIKYMFSSIGQSVSNLIKSGKLNKMIDDSLTVLKDIFSYIINGTSNFINNNKDSIFKSLKNVGNSVYNILIKSLTDGIKKSVETNDYTSLIVGALGLAGFYKIFTKLPFINQVDRFIVRPLIKVLSSGLLGGLSKLTPQLNILSKAITLLTGPIGIITAELGIITAGVYSMSKSVSALNKAIDTGNKQSSDYTSKTREIEMDFIKNNSKRISQLENKSISGEITKKEELEFEMLKIQKRNMEINTQIATIQENENRLNNTKWNGFMSLFGTQRKTSDYVRNELGELNTILSNNVDKLTLLEKSIKSASNISKNKQNELWLNETMKSIRQTKINDAQIVLPDKKDYHIFAKNDGPLDKNLKELNLKVDELNSIIYHGFSTMINTTTNGNGSIVNAIVSTGGKSSGVIPVNNSDNIRDYRNRAVDRINNK